MHTLIKSARRIRESFVLLICTAIAGIVVWRGLTYDHGVGDMATASICIALALSLVFTGIALSDCRN